MGVPTLTLCMIVRNVDRIIERCLASISPYVQEIIVVDTGSEDGTKAAVLRAAPHAQVLDFTPQTHPGSFLLDVEATWGGKLSGAFTGKPMLADFGAARQFGWGRATGDYVIWIDSDDVVEGGERLQEILSEMEQGRIDTAMINYDYDTDSRGHVICRLIRERIIRRAHGARWVQPVHEVCIPPGKAQFFDQVSIVHRRHEYVQKKDLSASVQHRNLKILLDWYDKHKDDKDIDPRMLFYLASEERWVWPERAIATYQKYCKLSGWDAERAVSHVAAGLLQERFGRYDEALSEYALAHVEFPNNPDGLFGCARIAYYKSDWGKVIEHTERGLDIVEKIEGKTQLLVHDPLDRSFRPYVYYSVALIHTQQMRRAIEACDKGLKVCPDDPHLKGNRELAEAWLMNKLKRVDSPQGVTLKFRRDEPLETPAMDIPEEVLISIAVQMWKRLREAGDATKTVAFLDALPEPLASEPVFAKARRLTVVGAGTTEIKEPANGLIDVLIWTGPGWENWSPKSLDTTGIGGSETAAVCMARELARLGARVVVASDCKGHEGDYEGVRYVDYNKVLADPEAWPCEVFICSRQPFVFDKPFKFKVSFLWVHDIHVGQPSGDLGRQLLKVDRFFCLSNWHKQFFLSTYPFIHPDSVIVTRNGIDPEFFNQAPTKIGQRLIYSSSPDRGLGRLLELFPEIRAEVPEAELHVYYGFENWKKAAEGSGNREHLERIAYFERALAETPGVYHHGRVSKSKLAKAFMEAKVWAYPTWFTETYCITALEAQAAGCVPVTTNLAALPETVKHGVLLAHNCTSLEYGREFVSNVVGLLRDDAARESLARDGRAFALTQTWATVSADWKRHFEDTLAWKAENPLPRFAG